MKDKVNKNKEIQVEKAYLDPPEIIKNPGDEYKFGNRKFQGIPSIACINNKRLWATWYGGKTPGEDHNNYVILTTSKDAGETWSEEKIVIDPDEEGPVRAFDPELWLDPEGKLWWFWAQGLSEDKKENLCGVWAMTSENPEDDDPQWSQPRRLTDGVMMCKPVVLATGEWSLPVSRWHKKHNSAEIVVSTDKEETWTTRGACDVPEKVRSFDEHMIVEKQDGSLWMLVRTSYGIGESISRDRGYTWSKLKKSKIKHTSSRFFIRRLKTGNLLLVKNGPLNKDTGRSQLTAYMSEDDGGSWPYSMLLDKRQQVSYPDGDQAEDGMIYIIYDFERTDAKEILITCFTEEDIRSKEVVSFVSKWE